MFTSYGITIEFGSEWAKVEEDCRMAIRYDSHSVKVSLCPELYSIITHFKCCVYLFKAHAAHHTKIEKCNPLYWFSGHFPVVKINSIFHQGFALTKDVKDCIYYPVSDKHTHSMYPYSC